MLCCSFVLFCFFFLTFLFFLLRKKSKKREYNQLTTQYVRAISRRLSKQTLSTPVHFTDVQSSLPSLSNPPFSHRLAFHRSPQDTNTRPVSVVVTLELLFFIFKKKKKNKAFYQFFLHACSHAELPCVFFFFLHYSNCCNMVFIHFSESRFHILCSVLQQTKSLLLSLLINVSAEVKKKKSHNVPMRNGNCHHSLFHFLWCVGFYRLLPFPLHLQTQQSNAI